MTAATDGVVCDLTLRGEPVAKGRPRTVGGRTYTPKATVAAEDAIRWQLRAAGVRPDADHLLAVWLRFRSSDARRRDLDNLCKCLLDSCNGFVWADDFQVVELHATVERRSVDPGTDLRVVRVGSYERSRR